jgi:hypothetical protein
MNLSVLNMDTPNTYIPWKIAWLVNIVFPFLIAEYVQNRPSANTVESSKSRKISKRKSQKLNLKNEARLGIVLELALYFVLISSVIQWVRLEASWFSRTEISTLSRASSAPNSSAAIQIKEILQEIDLVGGCIPWFQQLALIADLRLVSERSAGIKPNQSMPIRRQAFIYSALDTNCSTSSISLEDVTLIGQAEDLNFYEKKISQ